MKKLTWILASIIITAFSAGGRAQSSAPYDEGPVWELTLVRTKHGMRDAYLRSITKTFKAVMDEAKKEGLIQDYKVLCGLASSPGDFNILLMVQTKNMAWRDVARERLDPIVTRIEGNADQQRVTTGVRLDMREVLGEKLMREIHLR